MRRNAFVLRSAAWFKTLLLFGGACLVLSQPGCKKGLWIKGQWLHVDENGKPGMCYEFADKRVLKVFRAAACDGEPDPMLSGKWQLKEEHRLAVLSEGEGKPRLALINEHDETHFVSRGALAGSLHRLGETKPQQLLDKLREAGVIKLFVLGEATGCKQLGRTLEQIRALPKEENPRMLRARDQGLEYHAASATGDETIEKVVYALNQEQLDWVAFHLDPAAYAAPGPSGRLEQRLGKPVSSLTTGKGETKQLIGMWKAYCPNLRGAFNKDVDATLFSTPGKQEGVIYVSDGVIADLWEDLKATVASSPPIEDEEAESGVGASSSAASPAAAPAAAPAPAPVPAVAPAPAPVVAPAPAAAPPKAVKPAVAAPPAADRSRAAPPSKPGGRMAAPAGEDI